MLQHYANEHLKEWRELYGKGIVGVHVGNKHRSGKKLRYYCFVFHTLNKKDQKNAEKNLPSHIYVKLKGSKSKVCIPTDVEETGEFVPNGYRSGDRARNVSSPSEIGTIGFFGTRNGNTYACSNMHVLGPRFLNRVYFYCPVKEQNNTNIILSNSTHQIEGFLEEGVNDHRDYAIARVNAVDLIESNTRSLGDLKGPRGLNEGHIGTQVRLSGQNGNVKKGEVMAVGSSKKWKSGSSRTITNLIVTRLSPSTIGGDSGAALLSSENHLLGIHVGSDSQYAYAFPIADIIQTFGIKPITNTK